jgi:hypothetical protein
VPPRSCAFTFAGRLERERRCAPRLQVSAAIARDLSAAGHIGLVASTKRKLTHEAPARRKLVREADMGSIDQPRWNADRTALEAVYER